MQFIQSKAIPVSGAPYNHIVIDDHYAFIAGVVAADFPEGQAVLGDISMETSAVLKAIGRMLEEIGLSLLDVVRSDVHLADLDDFDALDEAYRKFFEPNRFPARTVTESKRLFGGSLVEITCMARLRK